MTLHLHNIAPADLDEAARHHPAMAIITEILHPYNLPPDTVAQQIVAALISAELLKQEQFYV